MVDVVDANGCTTQITVVIDEPAELLMDNAGVVNVSCHGLSDGTAEVSFTGGTAPYTLWINQNEQTTQVNAIQNVTFTGLPAGTHTATVQDVNGCATTLQITVTEPDELTAAADQLVDVLCFGDANGSARVTPTAGTAPYTVSIDNFATSQTVQANGNCTFTGLTAGDYTAVVRDAHGCETTADFTIGTPTQLVLAEVSTTDPLCFEGSDGNIVVNVEGGIAPYSMTLDGTDYLNNLSAGDQALDNLSAGTYTIMVTDANGCSATVTSTLGEPDLLTLEQAATTPITCFGGSDGTVTVGVAGGTATYDIWIDATEQRQTLNDATQTALFTDLGAGPHLVTVSDDHGCHATLTVTFIEPDQISAVVDTTTDVLCFGQSNGTATIIISGGTLPYVVSVDSTMEDIVLTTEDPYTIENLWANNYQVHVVDDHGCTVDMEIVIAEPDSLTVLAHILSNVSCFGLNDGAAEATATGGVVPYSYIWTGDVTGPLLSDIFAGLYQISVIDANGCWASDSAQITEPEPLHVYLDTITESCNGEATAIIEVHSEGGTPTYEYWWSNGETTDSLFNLAVGPYTVTVTDILGCMDTMTVEVPFHPLPDFTISTTTAYCDRDDGTATVVGSNTELYNYDWHADNNPNAPFNGQLAGGDYVLTVDDEVCSLDIPFTIGNVPGPVANLTADPTRFILGPVVRYQDHSSGDIATWLYEFGDGGTSEERNPAHLYQEAGQYWTVLTVTDEHDCFDTAMVMIEVLPDVIIYVPNAFTPNGDGNNDIWMPVISNCNERDFEMVIYNRWGQLIFQSNSPYVGWNGEYNGKEIEMGVYTYKITYYNILGKKYMKSGTVTLIR